MNIENGKIKIPVNGDIDNENLYYCLKRAGFSNFLTSSERMKNGEREEFLLLDPERRSLLVKEQTIDGITIEKTFSYAGLEPEYSEELIPKDEVLEGSLVLRMYEDYQDSFVFTAELKGETFDIGSINTRHGINFTCLTTWSNKLSQSPREEAEKYFKIIAERFEEEKFLRKVFPAT